MVLGDRVPDVDGSLSSLGGRLATGTGVTLRDTTRE